MSPSFFATPRTIHRWQSLGRYTELTDTRVSSSLFTKVSPLPTPTRPYHSFTYSFALSYSPPTTLQLLILSGWLPSIVSPAVIALPQVAHALSRVSALCASCNAVQPHTTISAPPPHPPHPPPPPAPSLLFPLPNIIPNLQAFVRSGMGHGLVATAAAWVRLSSCRA
jgi:hypothetical protein